MVRAKTESELAYEAAEIRRTDAEKTVAAAERITAGHPVKIEAKKRALRNLENTMQYSDWEQDNRASRPEKKADLECDLANLENELEEAQSALTTGRTALRAARIEATDASNRFSHERNASLLDAQHQKQELAERSFDLSERKFAQAEKDKLDAAQANLAKAEADGKTTLEIERYRAQAVAANLKFEWQQKREIETEIAGRRSHEIATANAGQLDLAKLQGEIAEIAANLSHDQALAIIDANKDADIERATVHGKIHRENVTHEVNEDIRKAHELLMMAIEKAGHDTLNEAKLLVIKHLLEKDRMSHAQTIAQSARTDSLEELAADMREVAAWNNRLKNPETNFEAGLD